MRFTVFAGPDPEANLRELLKRTPLRVGPVCAVTPDSGSAADLERMLTVYSGGAFTGHRVYTLEGLARAVLSRTGPAPKTIPAHVKRALIGEIAVHRIGSRAPWSTLVAYPGFLELLLSFLEDVRSTDSNLAGGHDLESVATAYDTHLRRLGMCDHEGWIARALEGDLVERFCAALPGSFIIHGFYDLTDRQRRFIERFLQSANNAAASLAYDPARPALFALPENLLHRWREMGARIVEVSPNFPEGTGVVFRGFRGGVHEGEAKPERVQLHTFRSVESETDWIAGTIRQGIASGEWDPGDIMIAARFRPEFGGALHNALRRNGIQVEGGIARPLANHPVARLALTAIDACIRPNDNELLGAVRLSAFTGKPGADRETGGGADFDDRAWNCMVEDGSPETFADSVRNMLGLLRVKENLNGGGDPVCAASEAVAWSRLQEALNAFVEFYTPLKRMMHAVEFSRLFRQFLQDITLAEDPSPGRGVFLADAGHARFVSRPVVFFTGLNNSAFPGRYGGFSLHSPAFARWKRDHGEAEDALLFYMAMQGAHTLYFTFPGIDDEGRDSTLSPYVREILDANAAWMRTFFHHGVPGAAWEGGSSDRRGRAENLLRALKADTLIAPALLALLKESDAHAAALMRKTIRTFVELAEDEGLPLRSERSLEMIRRDWGEEHVFGVTDLEKYAVCPVQFFLSKILRLRVDRETPGEMDPAKRGSVIHEILARFYRERLDRGETAPPDSETDRREMRKICETVFAARADVFESLHPVAMLAEKRFILDWMETFLVNEGEYFRDEPFRPEFLEVDFGLSPREIPATNPPLRIDDGDTALLVGGRIDRIDLDRSAEPPRLRVIDYKTGERKAYYSDLEAGRDLQLALYLRAASESVAPGSTVHDAAFYSLKQLEFSRYKAPRRGPVTGDEWDDLIDNACGHAVRIVEAIRAGVFPAGECAKNTYCDFLPLCRGGRNTVEAEESTDAGS